MTDYHISPHRDVFHHRLCTCECVCLQDVNCYLIMISEVHKMVLNKCLVKKLQMNDWMNQALYPILSYLTWNYSSLLILSYHILFYSWHTEWCHFVLQALSHGDVQFSNWQQLTLICQTSCPLQKSQSGIEASPMTSIHHVDQCHWSAKTQCSYAPYNFHSVPSHSTFKERFSYSSTVCALS